MIDQYQQYDTPTKTECRIETKLQTTITKVRLAYHTICTTQVYTAYTVNPQFNGPRFNRLRI